MRSARCSADHGIDLTHTYLLSRAPRLEELGRAFAKAVAKDDVMQAEDLLEKIEAEAKKAAPLLLEGV